MLFFAGLLFGALLTWLFANTHYTKRLNRAFWQWVKDQQLEGDISEETIKELEEEFDDKTKGIITIEKNK